MYVGILEDDAGTVVSLADTRDEARSLALMLACEDETAVTVVEVHPGTAVSC